MTCNSLGVDVCMVSMDVYASTVGKAMISL